MIVCFKNDEWSTIGLLESPNELPKNRILIVMLHPAGSNKASYRNTFVKFSRNAVKYGFATFRFDLPYEGESIVFSTSIDKRKATFDVIQYIKGKYNYDKIITIGHCAGGLLSINLTLKYANCINLIVLWHVVPILYGMNKNSQIPKFNLISTLKMIYSNFKKAIFNPRLIPEATILTSKLVFSVIVYPVKAAVFFINKMKKQVEIRKLNIKKTDITKKVNIIINPSRSHYKQIEDGMKFTKDTLNEMGFSNVEFGINENKVFSTKWQQKTFNQTLEWIKD